MRRKNAMKKVKKLERQLAHAAAQHIYVKTKAKTHKRMCVWVPREKIDDFMRAKARMQKRWGEG
jgi:hypothetical protein